MDKILILNGGYSEVPLIRAARAQGFYVLVTGKNENAVGNKLADEYIPWDYSDKEGICQLAASQKVSAICSGCNDFAYLSAAYTCEKLHLPGHDSYQTALTLHHKDLYRAFAKRVGIPVPEVVEYRGGADLERVESLHFPVIVKPVDLFGGMGMRKCHDMGEVREALSIALADSRMSNVLIEEFLEGTNHGFTAMIYRGKVVFSMLDREYHEHSPFAVSAASVPEPMPEGVVRNLKGHIERMADVLKLCDGLVHSQFILTEAGKPVILEVCRRSPGDLYIDFVKYATGVDYPGLILSCEAGRGMDAWMDSGCLVHASCSEKGVPGEWEAGGTPKVKGFWGRYVVVCKSAGRLKDVVIGDGLAPYIKEAAIAFERGKRIQEKEAYKCGVLFLEFQSQEEMETIMNRASDDIQFEMEASVNEKSIHTGMKKIVIIGANEFQNPLILKAGEMGIETHVFAWRDGAIGEENADYFYPVSITEKEHILRECQRIQPDGVATIGSDLAMVTVQYVASRLGLPCCTEECLGRSTNKYLMRQAFERVGISVPFYRCVGEEMDLPEGWGRDFPFPVVVKPTDRSGSRGVTKVYEYGELGDAIRKAITVSFEKKAIVESFLVGSEYSFESISQDGVHRRLAITKKYTTGTPNYIEVGHVEPSGLSEEICASVEKSIFGALDALGIRDGASHAEFKVDDRGMIYIIEIGARMGGDCIGSDLVFLSTGYDYVKMVIQASLGEQVSFDRAGQTGVAAVRFLFCQEDWEHLRWIQREFPDRIVRVGGVGEDFSQEVEDSGSRHGYYILRCRSLEEAEYLTGLEDSTEMSQGS